MKFFHNRRYIFLGIFVEGLSYKKENHILCKLTTGSFSNAKTSLTSPPLQRNSTFKFQINIIFETRNQLINVTKDKKIKGIKKAINHGITLSPCDDN